jgi:hypothetical protein
VAAALQVFEEPTGCDDVAVVLSLAGISVLRLRKEVIERRMLERRTPTIGGEEDDRTANISKLEWKVEGRR